MKIISAFLLSAPLLLIGSSVNALAVNPPLYAVDLSASLTTQTTSGMTSTIHTVHVNNHTITDAIFATGTSGVLKASDLALVINNEVDLEVINTSNASVVSVIATGGTNSITNAVVKSISSGVAFIEARSDYEFTLPSVLNVQTTNIRLTATANLTTDVISKLEFSFAGGDGTDSSGATFFQGTVKHTGKVYP